jgi:UDP-glucose 4-epimerase
MDPSGAPTSRVLVTGATTPLGRALVARLAADAAIAHVLAIGIEPAAPWPAHPRLQYLRVDLSRSRELRELVFGPLREQGIDSAILTAFHRAGSDGPRAYRLHVDAPRQLLHLAERHPTLRRIVFCSSAVVYRVESDLPCVIAEDHPLALGCDSAEVVRERVEADVLMCTRMGLSPLAITVLRLAEIFAPDSGSQLFDYVSSRVCLRPLGYDPMLNLLDVEDAARAIVLALHARQTGIYNIPGCDTLPLSAVIARMHRQGVPLPGPLLEPLYQLRRFVTGRSFRYALNAQRLHFTGLLDGSRAARELGYRPTTAIRWLAGGAEPAAPTPVP